MIALAILTVLAAQQPPPPAPPPSVTAIRAGTLIDGTGAAPVRNVVILVQSNRVTAVGTNVPVPSGATVIDLSGWTVLPGFVDAHVHLTGHIIGDGDWQHQEVAGTLTGATLLGLEREIGSVAAGKRADLAAVRGDPLQSIATLERVDFVMKDGRVFKRDGQVLGRSAAGVP